MRKEIAVIFAIGIVVGVAVSVLGETNVVPPIGITQGTADGLYVNITGDTITGSLAVDGNTTLGDVSGDSVICNAATITFPNGMTVGTDGKNIIFKGATITFAAATSCIVPNAVIGTQAMNRDTCDARYVELAGDTTTGFLTVGGNFTAQAAAIFQSTTTIGDTTGDVVNSVANTWNFKGTAPIILFENNATISVGAGVMTMTGQYNFGGPLLLTSIVSVGSVLFTGARGQIISDSIGLHYDNTNNSLGLGTASPDASTLIDMVSTSQGLGLPNMTTAQRDAITLPKTGLVIFDTTLGMSVENVGTPASPVWTGVGGGGPTIKSGAEASGSFTGNPRVATITFSTAFPDANYSVSVISTDARTWTIDSQVAASFVINTNASQALTASVSWTAIAHFDP